ncbi:MAG: SDR family oxidoreductase [Deltaproteobacteria bacterium]|nr:SDR family oxidoreductase [Deltaproteobacteria bacterium]
MAGVRFLVTGAAGFIGSNLVERLVADGADVVGLDNFLTGKRENVEAFADRFELVEGDVRDPALCRRLCRGARYVLHEAALASVPWSMEDPALAHDHNVNGTHNVLVAAREAGVERVVFASSAAIYGDPAVMPVHEGLPPDPLSPYALHKLVGEEYIALFHRAFGQKAVALRYFNVFGPRQDPSGAYAAAIPRLLARILCKERPVIFGDGEQTRDFCHVDNVVEANLAACRAPAEADGRAFNIGAGGRISLNALVRRMLDLLGSPLEPEHGPERAGDVRHSQAAIDLARRALGYEPRIDALAGLGKAIGWYKENLVRP